MNSSKDKNNKNPKNTEKVSPFKTHEELLQALYFIWETLDRVLIPFFLVGSTAESAILNQPLEGDSIHIGVKDTNWFGANESMMNLALEPVKRTQKLVTYEYEGTPIHLHIYKSHETIDRPDVVNYHYETFYVPNPYDAFTQVQSQLQ